MRTYGAECDSSRLGAAGDGGSCMSIGLVRPNISHIMTKRELPIRARLRLDMVPVRSPRARARGRDARAFMLTRAW